MLPTRSARPNPPVETDRTAERARSLQGRLRLLHGSCARVMSDFYCSVQSGLLTQQQSRRRSAGTLHGGRDPGRCHRLAPVRGVNHPRPHGLPVAPRSGRSCARSRAGRIAITVGRPSACILAGSNRSAAPHIRFATATAVIWVDLGCPWHEHAGRRAGSRWSANFNPPSVWSSHPAA